MKPSTTIIEKQVAGFLAASYGMVDAEVRSVVQGVNWTFMADARNGASYFLRLYRSVGRSFAEIDAEVRALLTIRATPHLAAAAPVTSIDGSYVSAMSPDGEIKRNVVLFKAALGRAVEMSTDDFKLVGKALADLHAQRDVTLACRGRKVLPEDIVEGTIERVARRARSGEVIARRLSALIAPLSRTAAAEGPVGFCHGDFRIANMALENDRVTLFDFDDCGVGPQWLDLATMAWWLEQDQGRAAAATLWQALLSGYGSVTLSKGFDRAICEMVIIQQFRSLRFLLDYCSLDEGLWADTFESALGVIRRASASALRIME